MAWVLLLLDSDWRQLDLFWLLLVLSWWRLSWDWPGLIWCRAHCRLRHWKRLPGGI